MKKELEADKKPLSVLEKVSDVLFYKGLSLISKNYRLYAQKEALYQKIKKNESKTLSQQEIDLILGSLQSRACPIKPKKISSKTKQPFVSITKSIRVYIHE